MAGPIGFGDPKPPKKETNVKPPAEHLGDEVWDKAKNHFVNLRTFLATEKAAFSYEGKSRPKKVNFSGRSQ